MTDAHSRYGHRSRPRELHLACPKCGARSVAAKSSEHAFGPIVGDLSPTWNLCDWNVQCSACAWRAKDLAYEDLPPLYEQFEARGIAVWAWNRLHLALLLELFEGRPVTEHVYGWFEAYVPRKWLLNRNRGFLAKVIREREGSED